jgi:ParB-like chromosome segregation protein Spo0J
MQIDKQTDLSTSKEKIECAFDEMVDVHKLVPNPKNPNRHSDQQIQMLSKIINYQGQRSPIVVSSRSGFLVSGHGRLEAIKKLGWDRCAVDYQHFEDEASEYAHMIADNKVAELAEHDDEMFKLEALNLQLDVNGFDLDLLGVPDLVISTPEMSGLDEKEDLDKAQEFKVEVLCVDGEEMTSLVNELSERGMIAKAIFRG